ncbi:uncharacterized protein BT62DRAFT_1006391 [Guyanagaster necrorhizus]|uniref:Uncharacterized protein n=1 Tax=Guyanagaster necrorhizus TaxID=856835 RepID=A0A9P7VT29_9AGAR|nr:uncharacterized protein BT62DRAFT_1006391 [Guyanagaster necrorhizus MCA 3950]KAG7446170.1 hypothetical protein BT62DRAFT_1006391 [Guyanagaster necrorhizus MCA 3950]
MLSVYSIPVECSRYQSLCLVVGRVFAREPFGTNFESWFLEHKQIMVFGDDHPYIRWRLDLVTTTIDSSQYAWLTRLYYQPAEHYRQEQPFFLSSIFASTPELISVLETIGDISRTRIRKPATLNHLKPHIYGWSVAKDCRDSQYNNRTSSTTRMPPKFTPSYGTRYVCDLDAPTKVALATGKTRTSSIRSSSTRTGTRQWRFAPPTRATGKLNLPTPSRPSGRIWSWKHRLTSYAHPLSVLLIFFAVQVRSDGAASTTAAITRFSTSSCHGGFLHLLFDISLNSNLKMPGLLKEGFATLYVQDDCSLPIKFLSALKALLLRLRETWAIKAYFRVYGHP